MKKKRIKRLLPVLYKLLPVSKMRPANYSILCIGMRDFLIFFFQNGVTSQSEDLFSEFQVCLGHKFKL